MASPSLQGILLAVFVATNCIELATSQCTPPQTPDHSTLVYERQHANPPRRLPNGYTIRVVCDDLFRLAEGDGFMTCRNGQWSDTFTCAAICDRLQSFSRGRITYTAGGTIARYSCTTPGYRLEGIRKRRCTSDGTWSGEPARCRGIPMCEPPELEEHVIQRRFSGRRKENLWIIGSILQFSCEERFTAVAQHYPAIECTRRGWNDTVPICVEGRCQPLLDTIENGNSSAKNRTYGPGEAIEFTCDRGYRTTTPSWRVCVVRRGSDGSIQTRWEGTTPECVETQCAPPRRIENGETIVFSTAVNGTAMFRCRSGFELIGEPVLTCQETGQWNGSIPVCDNGENFCPPLNAPLNGYKTGDRYSQHRIVEFSCASGYALSGSSQRECLSDGQWSGEEARCIGNLDFDDINQISAVLGKSLDRMAIDNLFENEVEQPSSNVSQHGRFIPSNHQYGVDLYFLFDASDSVGEENFEKAKRFARELVRKIGVTTRRNSLRVGAVYFAHTAEIAFHTVDFTSTERLIEEGINNIPYLGGGTNIADALRLVHEVMIPQSENRDKSYKTVFLITDGVANEGGSPEPEARLLEAQEIKIHCLGISEDASRSQLLAIGSLPHREHVFLVKNYNSLAQLVSAVVNQTVDYSECGVSENTVSRGRVVGGNDANPGAWPWQALLEIRQGQNILRCGGSLIDRSWILTAAHCVPTPHPDPRHRITVVLANRLIPPNPSDLHTAIVTGWGHNKTRAVNDLTAVHSVDRLQQLPLPLKSRDDCEESLEGDREQEFFDESMFCAGYDHAPIGACKGDSGGPLVKKAVKQKLRRWTLIGLTSWGRGCALANELDFFTNVPYFMDWITQTMNPPQEEEEGEGQQDVEDAGAAEDGR
ncbi:Complement factor B [Holothuria leucospilota]|uniref:C3/C5 convertase n=1 Tax=Holothuria leucospilota TaxID=206669 RepID=A0A9Q1H8E0_HOLLE|nr:Complement factor B [Holothuria leucospilota]